MKRTRIALALLFLLSYSTFCFGQDGALPYGGQKTGEIAPQQVRNVILMIGDGMGIAQVTQLIIENNLHPVNMERAEAVGLVRTFSANNRVTDSAAAGTALATGTKTANSMLGVDPDGKILESLVVKAERRGMPTGIVATSEIVDATPGAFYAHVHSRKQKDSIAVQMLDVDMDVIMGGARNYFDGRKDGRNLVSEFRAKGYNVSFDFDDAKDVYEGKLLALLSPKGPLKFMADGRGDYLPPATAKAIEILENNCERDKATGFFLMVEGSLIDWAAHENEAKRMLAETRDFDNAVGIAFDYADHNPGTLVIVVADHETGGLSIPSNKSDFKEAESGIHYKFGTEGHTASLVALYAYGTGAQNFSRVLDNTDIPKIISKLLRLDACSKPDGSYTE